MAINLELMQSSGTVREAGGRSPALVVPLERVDRLAAAGDIALVDSAEIFVATNKGEPVWFRVTRISDNGTDGAGNNNASVLLQTGDEFAFGIAPNTKAGLYNARIAAVV